MRLVMVAGLLSVVLGIERGAWPPRRRRWHPDARAALQLALLALVVLPLLPPGPFGPYGAIRPRAIGTIVLVLAALSFLGHLARRAAGGAAGYVIVGALGGLASSTAVTLSFARASRRAPMHGAALARGTVMASLIQLPRVLLVLALVNPGFAGRAAIVLLPAIAAGAIGAWRGGRGGSEADAAPMPLSRHPLGLADALRMAALFQLVLLVVAHARAVFGESGLFATAALAGLTDVDALSLAMGRLGRDPGLAIAAARALAVGVVANTAFKGALAAGLGSSGYRRVVVPRLAGMLAAGGVGIWLAGVQP